MNTIIKASILALGLFAAACSRGPDPSAANTANKHMKSGMITITQTLRPNGDAQTPFYNASATFVDLSKTATDPSDDPASPCKAKNVGVCQITTCAALPSDATPANDGSTVKLSSAGAISISSKHKVGLALGKHGGYGSKVGDLDFFEGSKQITIKAKGDDVPAFTKTINTPPRITLSEPAWPTLGAPLAIDRSSAFNLSWTGSAKGSVIATISTKSASKSVDVACKFDASKGKATIPASVIGKLATTDSGSIAIDTRTADLVQAGDWSITTLANSPALVAGGVAIGLASVN